MQYLRFPCVQELSVSANDRVDSQSCCLRKSQRERDRGGRKKNVLPLSRPRFSSFSLTPTPLDPFSSLVSLNSPRSIYQYSDMAPRLSGQISIFGVVFFVSKSFLGIERQRKL